MFQTIGSLFLAAAVVFGSASAQADINDLQLLAQDVSYALDREVEELGQRERQEIRRELEGALRILSYVTHEPHEPQRGLRGLAREILRQLDFVHSGDLDYRSENQIANHLMRAKRIIRRGGDRPYPPDRPDRPYPPDRPDRPYPPDRPDRPLPPRRPLPGGQLDYLCQGSFVGRYANGAFSQFNFQIVGGNRQVKQLSVMIILNGRESYGGRGTCHQNADGSATVNMQIMAAPQHQATISADGSFLSGTQVPGFAFQARRQ